MTSRQAKHQAKRRAEGGVSITVVLHPNEPELQLWFDVLAISNGPKDALKKLLNFSKPY
jgi:hypothetical protein